jgi:hypothetical protein
MAEVLQVVLLVPLALAGAVACGRWPTAAVLLVFALTGFQLTVTAYLGFPPAGISDLALLGLWLGVLRAYVRGSTERQLWLWAGLAAPAVYLAITFASILAADSTSSAFDSVRLAGWHMAALFMVAVAPWRAGTHARIARGMAALALAVGAYAVFRKLTGPSGSELIIHRGGLGRTTVNEPQQFFSSFYTSQDLAGWCAMVTPFALAMTLTWRGRWRIVAALAAMTCAFAMLAADRRAAVVGAVAGSLLVVALFLLAARPFGGRRLGGAFLAVTLSVAVGIGAYTVTVAQSPRSVERFESLIEEPSEDYTYKLRQVRWEAAIDTAAERPFGHGLGTVGQIGERRRDRFPIAPFLDSSYLKIAVEQGFPMLAVFAIAMLWLTIGLAWRGVNTSSPERATLAMGACGTIVVMLTLFYSSFFIERLSALAGWLIVGLAAAQFTGASDSSPSVTVAARRPARPPTLPRPPGPGGASPLPERPFARAG